ncbi:hypothetical protein AMTRI_Chr06g178530 [Amborella trichopoda]
MGECVLNKCSSSVEERSPKTRMIEHENPRVSPVAVMAIESHGQPMEKSGVSCDMDCRGLVSPIQSQDLPKRKRKRRSLEGNMSQEEKELKIAAFREEIQGLLRYYDEFMSEKTDLGVDLNGSMDSVIACLIEESELPLKKLVDSVLKSLKRKGGEGANITLLSVQNSIHRVGIRNKYGIENPNADLMEDESKPCLWCWETRELKLLPKAHHGILKIRRTGRRRIRERIAAVSEMISSLSAQENENDYKAKIMEASGKLRKILNLERIRDLVSNLLQKIEAGREVIGEQEQKLLDRELKNMGKELKRQMEEAEREERQREKELKRQQDEADKEQRRREREEAELKKQLKRQQEDAEKEQRRHEKEEAESKKQLKKQQEEAEKDKRRREKEEAERKKQLSVQKQAAMMKRFFKSNSNVNISPTKVSSPRSPHKNEQISNAVILAMDHAFSHYEAMELSDLLRSHLGTWQNCSLRKKKSQRWGMRHNPKVAVIKELRLQGSCSEVENSSKITTLTAKRLAFNDTNDSTDHHIEKLDDGWGVMASDDSLCHNASPTFFRLCKKTKKLLQFYKSHRPAYYGTMSKKSDVVGARHPFSKDPTLDYTIESDEEWEEDDPGESLSDLDKDDEEDKEAEDNLKTENEDGSEDSFLVPDGYLSENEGVQVNSLTDEEGTSGCEVKPEHETEEFRALLRQQRYLNNLTEQALRRNHALVITNLMHEKLNLMVAEDVTGNPRVEQLCLQALSIRPCFEGACVELSQEPESCKTNEEVPKRKPKKESESCKTNKEEAPRRQSKSSMTPSVTTATVLYDADLPEIVWCIQSFSYETRKLFKCLQRKFPSVSRADLRCKVLEIATFLHKRWQVKKEILDKLGKSVLPERKSEEGDHYIFYEAMSSSRN